MSTVTPKRSILVANAGSGKTWTLANRVLAWCFDELRAGRQPRPSAILAVTFTRKAAGEILARILTHAAQGAEDSAAGAEARRQFTAVVGVAGSAEYLAVLEALCRDLHRMQIGTIDGYFHRIASAMPDEVGLPPDWTMGEDREIELLRAEAAARVLSDPEAAQLVTLLEAGAPKASVVDSIASLIGGRSVSVLDHYRACAIDGDAGIDRAWRWVARIPQGSDVTGPDAGTHYRRVCDAWRALEIPSTADRKAPKPRTRWVNSHRVVLECLETKDFRRLAEQTILARLSCGEAFDKFPPPQPWIDACKLLEPHLRAALIAQVRGRIDGALAVMPLADRALAELQGERGIFTFGDVGLGVARAARRAGSRVADPSTLRGAIGSEIVDLAIDEAQDTSAEQFAALQPLIEDVLGVARTADSEASGPTGRFLVVGDPKQSIYGWRGGTPGLVAEMTRRYAGFLDPDAPLRKSFRSSKLLMDFVNRVFSNLADDVPPLVEDEAHRQPLLSIGEFVAREGLPDEVAQSAFVRALAEWRFEPHEAANTSLGGAIHAYAYGKPAEPESAKSATGAVGGAALGGAPGTPPGGESGDEALTPSGDPSLEPVASSPAPRSVTAAERAAMVAASLHRANPERTIGILVRTNRVANDVIEGLRAQGVPASDEGRATLLDSPAVVGLIQILRLVDEPSDRIAPFLASRGPVGELTGLTPLEEAASPRLARAEAERFAAEMRGRIADEGLARVLRGYIDALVARGLSARDHGRLERMVAIVEDLAAEPPARLAGYLDAIAADEADASSADRIRVMTVHASKGLEFDEVILASLDDSWGATPTDWASVAPDPTRPPALVGPLGNESIRRWVPELAVLERDERRRRLLDDLSLFYVAVTRARRGLHLVVSNDPGGTLPTASKLIAAALARAVSVPDTLSGARPFGSARAEARHDQAAPFWTVEYEGAAKPETTAAGTGEARVQVVAETPTAGAASDVAPDADIDVHRESLVELIPVPAGRARPPSSHDAAGLWSDDPFSNEDIPLRGVLVHECFREIRSIEDLAVVAAPATPELIALVARAAERAAVEKGAPVPAPMRRDAEQLLARIAAGVGKPGSIAEALRAAPSDDVCNEHPFLRGIAIADPSGSNAGIAVTAGRIDRLVLHRDADGRITGATILDYKTGAASASASQLGAKLAGYRAQMRAYCAAFEELWSLPSGSAAAKLLFVDRGEVVEVAAVVSA
ncbi:MAG: UvrD-helicase domain-containing protein [Planctomycetaceae bacterium]|nr:UvrD-helicase domain-containing protein [Planctomycetaceae bacterium]